MCRCGCGMCGWGVCVCVGVECVRGVCMWACLFTQCTIITLTKNIVNLFSVNSYFSASASKQWCLLHPCALNDCCSMANTVKRAVLISISVTLFGCVWVSFRSWVWYSVCMCPLSLKSDQFFFLSEICPLKKKSPLWNLILGISKTELVMLWKLL